MRREQLPSKPRERGCVSRRWSRYGLRARRFTLRDRTTESISSERSDRAEQHPLSVYGCGAHYSFVLDFGPELDIRRAARRLLARELAIVASIAGSEDLRVNSEIIKLVQFRDDTDRLVRFMAELNSEQPSWLKLFRIDPLHALRIALILLRSIRVQRRSENRTPDAQSEDGLDDVTAQIKSIPDDMSRVVIDRMVMLGARLRPEEALHFPSYFRSEPYIRMSLQRCFFERTGSSKSEVSAIEVSLMLNRSGIGILTFSVDIDEKLSFEMAQEAMSPRWTHLRELTAAQPLIDANLSWRRRWRKPGEWDEAERAEGVLWRTEVLEDNETGYSLTDVFDMYINAVCGIIGRQLRNEWHVFPVLSLGKPLCECTSENFAASHRDHLTALVRRNAPDGKYSDSVYKKALDNVLPTVGTALYISSSTAVLIDYEADSANFIRDMTVAVSPIESALSQHEQLRQIDILTSETEIHEKNLFTAQRLLTTGLFEYQRDIYVDESMQLVVDAVLEHRRTAQLYSRLLDRVRSLEALVTSSYSRTQNRRALGLSFAGFGVVLLLLLPRIAEAYDAFGRMGRWPSDTVQDLNDLTGGREATILFAYLAVAILAVVSLGLISVRWRRPRTRRAFGQSLNDRFALTLDNGREKPPRLRDRVSSETENSLQDE